jgi:glutamyl-tRNA reductase
MITLDPSEIGGIEESTPEARQERMKDIEELANASKKKKKQKAKKRGRSKIQTQLRRKQRNVVDNQVLKLREARDKEKAAEQGEPQERKAEDLAPKALQRFF